MKNSRNAPPGLSVAARGWWKKLIAEYEIADQAGLLLLQTALEAFDRMKQAQKLIKQDGAVVNDRFGQPRAHPAATIERDARAAMLSALKALNLDLEPLRDGAGRPPGR